MKIKRGRQRDIRGKKGMNMMEKKLNVSLIILFSFILIRF